MSELRTIRETTRTDEHGDDVALFFNDFESSNVARIGHVRDGGTTKVDGEWYYTAIVEFHSGAAYAYVIPEHLWDEFREAESKGKFLNRSIKPNYSAEKVEITKEDG